MSTEPVNTSSIDEGSTEPNTETLIGDQQKIEGKAITEYLCDECGKSFKNQQGLSGHIRHIHQAKDTVEQGQIGITDPERLTRILNEASIRASSGRDLITSIYFSGEDSPERLNKIMKSKAIPLGTRKLVAMAYFGQDIETMGVEEFLIGEETKGKGEAGLPMSSSRRQYEDMMYLRMMENLTKDKDADSSKLQLERERLAAEERIRKIEADSKAETERLRLEAEKAKSEAEKTKFELLQKQIADVQEKNNETIQGLFSTIQSNNEKSMKAFQDSIKMMALENQHQRELEAVKAQALVQSSAGDRPLVQIGKELNRTVRELPSSIAGAMKEMGIRPQPLQTIQQMSPQQQLEAAQRLRDQQAQQQEQQQ